MADLHRIASKIVTADYWPQFTYSGDSDSPVILEGPFEKASTPTPESGLSIFDVTLEEFPIQGDAYASAMGKYFGKKATEVTSPNYPHVVEVELEYGVVEERTQMGGYSPDVEEPHLVDVRSIDGLSLSDVDKATLKPWLDSWVSSDQDQISSELLRAHQDYNPY